MSMVVGVVHFIQADIKYLLFLKVRRHLGVLISASITK